MEVRMFVLVDRVERLARWVLSSTPRTMRASWLATVLVVLAVVWRLSGGIA